MKTVNIYENKSKPWYKTTSFATTNSSSALCNLAFNPKQRYDQIKSIKLCVIVFAVIVTQTLKVVPPANVVIFQKCTIHWLASLRITL